MPDAMPDAMIAATPAADMLTDPALFAHLQQVARLLCRSALVPDHLKENDGADLLLALQIAREQGESPVSVMHNLVIVSGRTGWSMPCVIDRANRSGVFTGRLRWQVECQGSDALAVTARATLADTGEGVEAEASLALARAEGWDRDEEYRTAPEQMLRQRSAAMLVRLHCPEVLAGLPTAHELEDRAAAGTLRDAASRDVTDEGYDARQPTTADAVGALLIPQAAVPSGPPWQQNTIT